VRTSDGQLTAGEVLAHVRQPGTSVSVARASLSRTLRRLWTAGCLELWTRHPEQSTLTTLTEAVAYWRARYAQERAAPEAAYSAYCQDVATGATDFGSAAAYLEALRAKVTRPYARVRRVVLLPTGRAMVNN
jgi:hypothetical protein